MVWEIKGVNICCKEKKSLLENSEMGGGGGRKGMLGRVQIHKRSTSAKVFCPCVVFLMML